MSELLSSSITFNFPGSIRLGYDIVLEIAQHVREIGGNRPFIVAGPNITKLGVLDLVLAKLEKEGMACDVFQESQLNPTDKDVALGLAQYREANCDIIIAIGGGSRMDVAKAIRLLAAHEGNLDAYYFDVGGADRINPDMPPLICIPTTAGSGSETSRGAIITDTNHNRKRLIAGPGLTSSLAILDPKLTQTMSPKLTAETGIDAFSHAIETYVGTNFNPIAQGIALKSATMIYNHLPKAVENGADLQARTQMLMASTMAAIGFAKGLGVVHSLAHQLSPESNVSHGLAVAIFLPFGMEFNMNLVSTKYAEIARAIGIASTNDSDESAASAIVNSVRNLIHQFGLSDSLSKVGVSQKSIPSMATKAMLDHCHRTNPRPCTEEDMRRLFERAF